MLFADFIEVLSKELDMTLEIEDDVCAVEAHSADDAPVTILLTGVDERGIVLFWADLGLPPAGTSDMLMRTMMEANDLFGGTGGATLSYDATKEGFRLQRIYHLDVFRDTSPSAAFMAFADVVTMWRRLIAECRSALTTSTEGQDSPLSVSDGLTQV